jgi:uncharacterized coiled-coil protein SlyX
LDTDELKQYIEENSSIKAAFMEKTMAQLNKINEERSPAIRQNNAELQHQADRMFDSFVDNIYQKILSGTPLTESDSAKQWTSVIEEAEILDNLEESIADSDFDE